MSFTPTTLNYPQLANTAIRRYKASHAPNSTKNFVLGDEWLDTSASITGRWWKLSTLLTGGLVWVRMGGGNGLIETLTGDVGGAVAGDSDANIFTLGTANQITVTGTPGTHTLTWSLTNGVAVSSFDIQANSPPGTDPVVPTNAGVVTVNGDVVAAHSVPLETRSRAANAYNVEAQYASAIASTDGTQVGMSAFDSAIFTVDATGFVTIPGGGAYISLSPFIVGTDVHSGYATIAAGIAAAVTAGATNSTPQNVYIKPKVDGSAYTENVILPAGVNLVAFGNSVRITGKISKTTAGSSYIQGLVLLTNGDVTLEVSGSAASTLTVERCILSCTDGNAISLTSSSASSSIVVSNSSCSTSAGRTFFTSSGAGTIALTNNIVGAGDLTPSTISSGTLTMRNCFFSSPIVTSGTVIVDARLSNIGTGGGAIALTVGGTTGVILERCTLASTGFEAMSIAAASVVVSHYNIFVSDTNAITGAGTLTYGSIDFQGSKVITTTTQNQTNGGTWTPVLSFGGSSAGITYGVQLGHYTRVSNIVYFKCTINLTSKGAQVGAALISGLPVTSASDSDIGMCPMGTILITNAAGYTCFGAQIQSGVSTILPAEYGSASNSAQLTDASFVNTSGLKITGFYFV